MTNTPATITIAHRENGLRLRLRLIVEHDESDDESEEELLEPHESFESFLSQPSSLDEDEELLSPPHPSESSLLVVVSSDESS